MDLIANLALGFSATLEPQNILYCLIGVTLGTLIGVLPGLGPTATMAMLLPITLSLEPTGALIMLAGIFYGAQYGGSTTAILINLPGETSATVTALDGYQMAQQGRAGPALATAAIGSFFAGTVATIIVAVCSPALTTLALKFGPAEYFALIVLGLICSVTLAQGSVIKAVGMIVMGLALSLVGTDVYTNAQRFTFGNLTLADGLDFVALSVGLFGLSEILRNLESSMTRDVRIKSIGGLMPTREDFKAMWAPILRGTFLGSLLGVLPGGGAVLSSFAAYAMEKKISKTPERFGKGAIEGLAAPESANNAGAQTSFIPMLTLGIPSSPVMAMMIGAMIMQGITPGPSVATSQPALFWGIIASMWLGNLFLVILNLPLVGMWVKILKIPYRILFPAIVAFCTIGVFSVNENPTDLIAASAFGLFGYLLVKLRCEPAPLLLGFVLGPQLEEHLRRAMLVARGDPMLLIQRPITAGLLVVSLVILALMIVPAISKKREVIFKE
jgi:TctA family transporter